MVFVNLSSPALADVVVLKVRWCSRHNGNIIVAVVVNKEASRDRACWDSMGGIKQCRNLHFRAGRQD